MTFDEKEALNDRINAAVKSLDADYQKAQNDANYSRERYWHMRELAEQYHKQRMILLEAQRSLWYPIEEDF